MKTMTTNAASDIGKLILRTILSLIFLIVLVYVGKKYVGSYLEIAAKLFFEKFGLVGLFIGVYFVDTFIVPLTPDIFLILLVPSEIDQRLGLTLICIASILGGISGYGIGKNLNTLRIVQRLVSKYKHRGENLFQRYGIWAVVIAAATPLPFSTICWLAGIFRMNFRQLVLATFFRIPRMAVYYLMIALGWIS